MRKTAVVTITDGSGGGQMEKLGQANLNRVALAEKELMDAKREEAIIAFDHGARCDHVNPHDYIVRVVITPRNKDGSRVGDRDRAFEVYLQGPGPGIITRSHHSFLLGMPESFLVAWAAQRGFRLEKRNALYGPLSNDGPC